jgi:amino acid transporter
MLEEYENKRRKQVSFMRSVLDYGMGLLFIILGVMIFLRDKLNLDAGERFKIDVPNKVIGVVFALYGLWRIYKGYKKNYFQ